jgi:2-polyprenyl-3-methyl-5-hydroxy-6-metoxy-1,4-benzoquinol methylase
VGVDRGRLAALLANEADMAFKRRVALMFESLDLQPNDRVLDAGCGRGFFMHYVAALAPCRLTGVDLQLEHLAIALRHHRNRGGGVARAAVDSLPFSNGRFDKIVFSEVLEHLPDDRASLDEVVRVLKPGGLLFLTVPNHDYPFWWDPINKTLEALFATHVRRGPFAGIWAHHQRLYTRREIESLATAAGLEVLASHPLVHSCFPFAHNLVYGLGKPLFESGVLPPRLRAAADRFDAERARPGALNPIRLGLRLFNWIDRRNDVPRPGSTFVIHALLLRKSG